MRHAIALVATVITSVTAKRPVLLGGWQAAPVTDDNVYVLTQALRGTNFATSVGDTRVCFADVTSIETQVVAGTNYLFHIRGCDVDDEESAGSCSATILQSCHVEAYAVKVFEQPWTDTLQVTSIKQVEDDRSTDATQDDTDDEDVAVQHYDEGIGRVKAADMWEVEDE
ncbi:hypothetical protein PsorP6_001686 [Peronosclerospora sorghi]|uniref:Uncharacterized protein n=1 Tax=Peronosclerospora sorghi TaxID=230839 RepID=A0ACC0WTL4_9STRA|nr:hypothetical protein PsorP6_001686 [Peronosclerospora sorghi]